MKKVKINGVISFLNFRSVCEKFKIKFDYWVKKGGVYIVEAKKEDLEIIGF